MFDFDAAIDIRYYTDNWGPFSVNLIDSNGVAGIPDNETVSDVAIKAFEGNVQPSDDISQLTNVADDLIEANSITYSGKVIYWEMQYPASPATFKGKKYTLIFEVTTSGGRKYPFYLNYAKVW